MRTAISTQAAGRSAGAEQRPQFTVEALEAHAYRFPTDQPESDGTLEWTSTTMVVVRARGAGESGMGYTYADRAASVCVNETLAPAMAGHLFTSPGEAWEAMVHSVRNLGHTGIAAMAISATDVALWDLYSRLLGVPLGAICGAVRQRVRTYASGGFTSYSEYELCRQMAGWAEAGFGCMKMKVGRHPAQDRSRVQAARRAIGPGTRLFVDANGAYGVSEAIGMAKAFAEESDVSWLEEPRPAADVDGTQRVRARAPAGMDIAGGEYIYNAADARRLIDAGCLDVLQLDVTRCGGLTGFMRLAALAEGCRLPISAHCAPAISAVACACAPGVRHLEYFHDHERIERRVLRGWEEPRGGELVANLSRPGHGLEFLEAEAGDCLVE